MPVVFRYKGFCFFFCSNEGSPREPIHMHVIGQGGEAKFWTTPVVTVSQRATGSTLKPFANWSRPLTTTSI